MSAAQLGRHLKRRLLHHRVRQLSQRDWRRRFDKVFEANPEYVKPCARDVENEHTALWRQLRPTVNLDTLRVAANISGISDPRIVPEEVFVSEIEHCLNRHPSMRYAAHKSFYNRWFGKKGRFPEVFVHNIEGDFYNGNYKRIHGEDVSAIADTLSYPVVMKPNMGSFGGKNITFVRSSNELKTLVFSQSNFVVQEQIQQAEFCSQFNRIGLNTFRVCVYRSVVTNDMHVLGTAFRMGRGGSLDNETDGGIVCFCRPDGRLNSYAVDKYGGKLLKHPDTNVVFAEVEPIPRFEEMQELARTVAQDVFLARLIGLDLCLDADGRWRVLEINLGAQTIRFSQYAGEPFLGRFTQEIVDYCKAHPDWR